MRRHSARRALQVAEGDGEGVGGISRRRGCAEPQPPGDHMLDLAFVCRSIARHRGLDCGGRILEDLNAGRRRHDERNAGRSTHVGRCRQIAVDKYLLEGHGLRLGFFDQRAEVTMQLEQTLGDGQISILIGRTDLWHQGYGTAGTKAALDKAFSDYGLYRVWVDIPEYNTAARSMFTHLGFVHEGTLRQSRPHEGSRFDSVVMGMLAIEYAQRVPDETTEVHSV